MGELANHLRSVVDEELMLLSHFGEKHPEKHFDRLPSCPLCIDKLDTTVTGLQQIPKVSHTKSG